MDLNIMSYDDFKNEVRKSLEKILSADYPGVGIKLELGTKHEINKYVDIIIASVSSLSAGPSFNLEKLYDRYKQSENYNEVVEGLVSGFKSAIDEMIADNSVVAGIFDLSDKKSNIVMEVINTKCNREYLETVPHREFLDLSIIYRVVLDIRKDGVVASAIINNSLAETANLSEEQLFSLAYKNMPKRLPFFVKDMYSIMFDLSKGSVDVTPETNDEVMMFVFSNESRTFGATAILYKDVLDDFACKVNSSFYIFPSSIDELVVLLSDDKEEAEELANEVFTINMDCVDSDKRLSNNVYYYDKDTKEVSIVFESPMPLI